ncbi:CpaF family protein [Glutamicibacter nicotianae]|uniref:CpaF family protein n=1 Tax=Glutamicibacter nicotianae TaxID=37929 RepID=UPI000EF8C54E|nr:ATPase, T2SS/T4P/T4SS family [Glutamicibacter nicotianae]
MPDNITSGSDQDLRSLPFFASELTAQPSLKVPASVKEHLNGEQSGRRAAKVQSEARLEGSQEFSEESEEYWETIQHLRGQAAELQSQKLMERPDLDNDAREQMGRQHIKQVVLDHVKLQIRTQGQEGSWSARTQEEVERTLRDYMFGLGPFQKYVDDESVENITVNGCDEVWTEHAGGEMRRQPSIAPSDRVLVDDVQFLLNRKEEEARPFDQAHPDVDADLMEMVRLAAVTKPVTMRPVIVLRVHRFLNITLDEMVQMGNLTESAAHFLRAVIAAKRSVVFSGYAGDGKTTMLRAVVNEFDPYEPVITMEMERELHLHHLSSRAVSPISLQYRPAGEAGGAGEYSMWAASRKALRLNAFRFIVGEVRGDEIGPMIRAMQTGAGSLSTAHAEDPEDCVEALVGLASQEYSEEYAKRQIARHIDFIVQLNRVEQEDGSKLRKVTHITEVLPHETHGVTTLDLFHLDEEENDEHAKFLRLPSDSRMRRRLARHGLKEEFLRRGF